MSSAVLARPHLYLKSLQIAYAELTGTRSFHANVIVWHGRFGHTHCTCAYVLPATARCRVVPGAARQHAGARRHQIIAGTIADLPAGVPQ